MAEQSRKRFTTEQVETDFSDRRTGHKQNPRPQLCSCEQGLISVKGCLRFCEDSFYPLRLLINAIELSSKSPVKTIIPHWLSVAA